MTDAFKRYFEQKPECVSEESALQRSYY